MSRSPANKSYSSVGCVIDRHSSGPGHSPTLSSADARSTVQSSSAAAHTAVGRGVSAQGGPRGATRHKGWRGRRVSTHRSNPAPAGRPGGSCQSRACPGAARHRRRTPAPAFGRRGGGLRVSCFFERGTGRTGGACKGRARTWSAPHSPPAARLLVHCRACSWASRSAWASCSRPECPAKASTPSAAYTVARATTSSVMKLAVRSLMGRPAHTAAGCGFTGGWAVPGAAAHGVAPPTLGAAPWGPPASRPARLLMSPRARRAVAPSAGWWARGRQLAGVPNTRAGPPDGLTLVRASTFSSNTAGWCTSICLRTACPGSNGHSATSLSARVALPVAPVPIPAWRPLR